MINFSLPTYLELINRIKDDHSFQLSIAVSISSFSNKYTYKYQFRSLTNNYQEDTQIIVGDIYMMQKLIFQKKEVSTIKISSYKRKIYFLLYFLFLFVLSSPLNNICILIYFGNRFPKL